MLDVFFVIFWEVGGTLPKIFTNYPRTNEKLHLKESILVQRLARSFSVESLTKKILIIDLRLCQTIGEKLGVDLDHVDIVQPSGNSPDLGSGTNTLFIQKSFVAT